MERLSRIALAVPAGLLPAAMISLATGHAMGGWPLVAGLAVGFLALLPFAGRGSPAWGLMTVLSVESFAFPIVALLCPGIMGSELPAAGWARLWAIAKALLAVVFGYFGPVFGLVFAGVAALIFRRRARREDEGREGEWPKESRAPVRGTKRVGR